MWLTSSSPCHFDRLFLKIDEQPRKSNCHLQLCWIGRVAPYAWRTTASIGFFRHINQHVFPSLHRPLHAIHGVPAGSSKCGKSFWWQPTANSLCLIPIDRSIFHAIDHDRIVFFTLAQNFNRERCTVCHTGYCQEEVCPYGCSNRRSLPLEITLPGYRPSP